MLLSHRPKDKIVLILGVQSTIVRCILVSMRAASTPLIFYSQNSDIQYQPRAGTSHLIRATLKTIRESVDGALQFLHAEAHLDPSLPKNISAIDYVLSSPWIVSRARTIDRTFPHSTTVSKKVITDIINRERMKDVSDNSSEVETVEEKIFDVNLNGYSVAPWEGKSAEKMEVSFATSIAGTVMLEKFRETVAHAVHHASVHFHSSLLLQYVGIHLLLPEQNSYMLIHIHGELTDIVVVEHNVCVFFGSFPKGVNTVRRSIARALNATAETADSLMVLSAENETHEVHNKRAETALTNMALGWSGELTKLFSRSSYTHPLPKTAFISARSHEDFFARIFRQAHPNLHLETFSADDLKPFVAFGPNVEVLRLAGAYTIALHQLEH